MSALPLDQADLTEDEEAAVESDRRFFGRFPDRKHYIRPCCRSEVEKMAAEPPKCTAWFTVVRKFGPGVRMRLRFLADANMIFAEANERDALAIWEKLCGPEVRP